ncbi:single-stranded DNA-binding protein [Salmonella enterica]|uniref:Single-stranded DNA-binding protein n=1 Tax=Salmonella enterica subsp. enterica serovar Rough O:d:1,7 TaxID=1974323 RepID=A0A974KE98_SALET|nr:single-stranded DNA-binding protein [Salmonella enterica]ECD7242694.1 single-stranded DNA-binding protein [Salmonella enterica subsp. enterica serovar Florida]EDL0223023.1 single-stranded DNA-binding protein [Salmonella enterica subsp. diarizonae]ECF4165727.1 single-stranded DNA-binding protein [Salmonella enterica subsp. enterica serovar Florida]ECW2473568.1 single-stranded DNA-binding protein [Salmonella enterica subsp. enterica serovar Florida]EIQ6926622.1 single-stranded DNA-binding pro
MTAQIAAYGRIAADIQTKTTSNGNNMAFTRMAVSLPCRTAENGEAVMWLGVTAFGKQADALARHTKGDLVSVSGQLQINQWTGQDGGTHSGYAMVADSVISARTVRPGGNPQKSAGKKPPAQATTPNHDEPPFPDDIPF